MLTRAMYDRLEAKVKKLEERVVELEKKVE